MDEGVFFLPRLLDGSFPGVSSGRLCTFPPNLDRACLGRILRRWSYLAKDEVTDVKFFQLHPSIVVFSYLLLVLGHPLRSLIFYLIQKVQVLPQLVVVVLLVEKLPPEAGEPYFNRDDYFCAVGQVKWCLPCGCSRRRPIRL